MLSRNYIRDIDFVNNISTTLSNKEIAHKKLYILRSYEDL
jgi:hypothetical protein